MSYTFRKEYNNKLVEYDVTIPFDINVEELAHIIIAKFKLPIYTEKELSKDLSEFISKQESQLDESESLSKAKDIDEIAKDWEKLMKDELAEFGDKRCASDEELFAMAYHKMVHSPALETMLQLEHMYAQTVRQRTEEKNHSIQHLSEEQSQEMNKAVDSLGLERGMTESRINKMVAQHYEAHSLLKAKFTSELDTIKESQRREYREWLMQMLEQNQANSSLPTPSSPLTPSSSCSRITGKSDHNNRVQSTILEESFTIHLGCQQKQMHNIRIVSSNVMDLFTIEDNSQSSEPTPQILQTALALYSNDLSGLVLMTDNKIGSRLSKDFQELCLKTTEFHFSHVDDQLDQISNAAQNYLKQTENGGRNTDSELLKPGDFYMTRHSNLAQVHVIFHMVSDDSLRSSDINSRHPVVLGLRNILKTACSNDITSVTIPLLLQFDLTEEMTVPWCEKRAELVFKCVKGFMIEMASWGGSELKNLHFMLPPGISSKVFQSMADMLPRIFKLSNPKVFK